MTKSHKNTLAKAKLGSVGTAILASLIAATPANAQHWVVSLKDGPLNPVRSCIVTEDAAGFHHIANGRELPPGYICDDIPKGEEPTLNGGNVKVDKDTLEMMPARRATARSVRPAKVCREGACPTPKSPK